MELWLFDGENLEDLLQQAWSLWSGRHVNSKRVQYLQFKEIILESDTPIYLQLDGEPEIGGKQVAIAVLPKSLRVLIPDKAPKSLFQANQQKG
jgi:diacylglycerol kinase family enzyme